MTRRQLASVVLASVALLGSAHAGTTTISVADTVASANDGPAIMQFPLLRDGDLGYDVVLAYHTSDGTARAGKDYLPVAGKVIMLSNNDSTSLPVVLSPNTSASPSVTLQMQLDGVTGLGPRPSFSSQQTFATGQHPNSVVSVDLNGDGKPDVVVANLYDNTISVYINVSTPGSGDVSFGAQQTFSTGVGPFALAAADINHDGRPDVVVANAYDNTVSVLLNQTAAGSLVANFAGAQSFPTGANPESIAAADLNNDGSSDLIVANASDGTVSLLLNATQPGAGTVSFIAQQVLAVGASPSGLAAVDLNNDGKIDLAVTNFADNTISILTNNTADGSSFANFSPQKVLATGVGPISIAAADINGDHFSDLVVANFNSNSISALINVTAPGSADSSFQTARFFAVGSGPYSISASDLNGDGKLELMVANLGDDTVSVLENATSSGSLAPYFLEQEIFAVGTNPVSVIATDLTGDGKADLVAVNYNNDNTISVLLNSTSPSQAKWSVNSRQEIGGFPNYSDTTSVAVADINGDGTPDLVAANDFGASITVFLNRTLPGDPVLSVASGITFTFGQVLSPVVAADINGDGLPDLVVGDRGANCVWVLLNTTVVGSPNVSFADPVCFETGEAPSSVVVADVNNDGKPDILVNNPMNSGAGSTVSVLLNATNPGAASPAFLDQQTVDIGDASGEIAAADIDGDGTPDLLVANTFEDTVSLLINRTGDGASTISFGPRQTFATGPRPVAIAIADINGDGRPDLIVGNYQNNTASILLNMSQAGSAPSFAPPQTIAVAYGLNSPSSVVAADVDGDGRPDLAFTDSYGSAVDVFINATAQGSSTVNFLTPHTFTLSDLYAGYLADSLVVTDLNRDGRPDFLIASSNAQRLFAWTSAQYEPQVVSSPGTGTIVHDYIFLDGFE